MTCLRCRKGEFETRRGETVEQEFRGETFVVHGDIEVCQHCRWRKVTDEQAEMLARHTVDAYRRKHGLLTEDEIRALRKQLGMSQVAFARFVGVSPVAVKRWETGQVQEAIYDRAMRERCQRHAAVSIPQWLVRIRGVTTSSGIVVQGVPPAAASGASIWTRHPGRPSGRRSDQHLSYDSNIAVAA